MISSRYKIFFLSLWDNNIKICVYNGGVTLLLVSSDEPQFGGKLYYSYMIKYNSLGICSKC